MSPDAQAGNLARAVKAFVAGRLQRFSTENTCGGCSA